MEKQRLEAARMLVAKTHFAPAAAQQLVAELSESELQELLEIGLRAIPKPPLEAWLAVRQARQALQHADPKELSHFEAGLQSATVELQAAQPPAPSRDLPVESAVPPGLTVPVSPETTPRKRR